MTDKEIIEKLKISGDPDNIGCAPTSRLCREALNLINRQQETINGFTMIGKLYSEIKAEAVKEFTEALKVELKTLSKAHLFGATFALVGENFVDEFVAKYEKGE